MSAAFPTTVLLPAESKRCAGMHRILATGRARHKLLRFR